MNRNSRFRHQFSDPLFKRNPGLESQCLPAIAGIGESIPHIILYWILYIFLLYILSQLGIDHPDHFIEAECLSHAHIEYALAVGFHGQAQGPDHIMSWMQLQAFSPSPQINAYSRPSGRARICTWVRMVFPDERSTLPEDPVPTDHCSLPGSAPSHMKSPSDWLDLPYS